MPQFFDSAEPAAVSPVATTSILPSTTSTVSAFGATLFSEFNSCAWLYPCRYHTRRVTTTSVRLGASVSG